MTDQIEALPAPVRRIGPARAVAGGFFRSAGALFSGLVQGAARRLAALCLLLVFGLALGLGSARDATAGTQAGLRAAFEACRKQHHKPNNMAGAMIKAGWQQVTDPGGLLQAQAILGDAQAVKPAQDTGDRFTASFREMTRANVARALRRQPDERYQSLTLRLDEAAGQSFVNIQFDRESGTLWCTGGSSDPQGGAAFFQEIHPDAPALSPGQPYQHTRHAEKGRRGMRLRIDMMRFEVEAASARLGSAFLASTGFVIRARPREAR